MPNNSVQASAGDDLYRLSARIYGDASAWTLLARANDLTDPIIVQDMVLIVPDYSAGRAQDGVLADQ